MHLAVGSMNELNNAGDVVERALLHAYQQTSDNMESTMQIDAMYPQTIHNRSGVSIQRYTVVASTLSASGNTTVVCFGMELQYCITNPNTKFYEDLKDNILVLDQDVAGWLYND